MGKRPKSRRRLLYAAAGVALAAAIAAVALLDRGGGTAAGRPAPPLPREVLVPPRATIASLRGRPAAVNFWASWCEQCRREAPALERLALELHGRASLVGVDWSDDPGAARGFLRRYGWTFPVLRDSGGGTGERYGVLGLPTTFVLDRRGRIARVLRGPQTAADVARALGVQTLVQERAQAGTGLR